MNAAGLRQGPGTAETGPGGPVQTAQTGPGGPVQTAQTGPGGPVQTAQTGPGGPVQTAQTGPGGPVQTAQGKAGRLETRVAWRPLAIAVGAAGCALLAARPPILARSGHPVGILVLLFVALLVVGACWPVRGPSGPSEREVRGPTGPSERDTARPAPDTARMAGPAVLGLGVGAFAVARVLGGGEAPGPEVAALIALNTLAAVAEEAFFRRFLYDTLLAEGALVAVLGSAALFALVHVTIYGPAILPIDLAAGLLLSWQRWASGSWHIPAVTHVLANVLVVI